MDNTVNKMMKTNIDSSNAEVTNISMWRATFEGLSPATRYNVTIIATYEDESRRLISAPSSIELFTSSSEFISNTNLILLKGNSAVNSAFRIRD